MKDKSHTIVSRHGAHRGNLRSYSTGFILSLILTFAAYILVVENVFSGWVLFSALVGLAISQLLVQLIFFLHLGSESKPRWNLLVFLFMLLVLIILVFGSLWIMNNLNYHNMSPSDTNKYVEDEELIKQTR
jgi:cytochrome o ubiquinol oxidase subunit IV